MDKDSFIEMIRDHQRLIYKICNMYCQDPYKRKDLEQEIFIQLWTSIDRFDGRVKVSTWMYKVALNTAITFYRKDDRYHSKRQHIDSAIISMAENENDPEQDEKITFLNQLIQKLNMNERALMLLYFDEVKYKEIAEILGISETNVATKISRIKMRLKEQMLSHFKN